MAVQRTEHILYRRYRPAVASARATARRLANEWGLTKVTDSLKSAVSELVANAVVHGRAPRGSCVSVSYRLDAARLRVEVRDWATGMPRTVRPAPAGAAALEHGRGLRMVAALTDRWGVIPRVIGKSVWFEINTETVKDEQPMKPVLYGYFRIRNDETDASVRRTERLLREYADAAGCELVLRHHEMDAAGRPLDQLVQELKRVGANAVVVPHLGHLATSQALQAVFVNCIERATVNGVIELDAD